MCSKGELISKIIKVYNSRGLPSNQKLEKYILSLQDSKVDEIDDELTNLERSLSKLKMSGISLNLMFKIINEDTSNPSHIHCVQEISSDTEKEFTLNCGNINNGNIKISSDIISKLNKNKTLSIDISKLNLKIQDKYTLSKMSDLMISNYIINRYVVTLDRNGVTPNSGYTTCKVLNKEQKIIFTKETISQLIEIVTNLSLTDIIYEGSHAYIQQIIKNLIILKIVYGRQGKFSIGSEAGIIIKTLDFLNQSYEYYDKGEQFLTFLIERHESNNDNTELAADDKQIVDNLKIQFDAEIELLNADIIKDSNNPDTNMVHYTDNYITLVNNIINPTTALLSRFK